VKKKTIGKIFIGIVLSAFIIIQYIVVDRVLKQSNDLNEIHGVISNIQKIQIPKRYFGYNYAYVLTIDNEPIRFAIQEKNQRAYDFINFNQVQGGKAKLLYDKKGFNSQENLTNHVYYLEIDGQQILNIDESKQTDKFGLIIFFAGDLFIIGILIYLKKRKNILAQHQLNLNRK